MKNLGAAMAGGGGVRRDHDFYPTPREAVEALLERASGGIGETVWEPACGDGAICKVLTDYGYTVVGTDLVDRGYGEGGVDFLTAEPRSSSIITNPPFKLAAEFIKRGREIEPAYFALLLKATFWNAASRLPIFNEWPPESVLPLTWRLDFTGGGAPTMDCMWCVWGYDAPQLGFEPLRKPRSFLQ